MGVEALAQTLTSGSDDLVLDELCEGVFTRLPRAHIAQRDRLLRQCALLARAWLEGYERKMPALEHRTHCHLDAQAQHAWRVSSSISRIVERATRFGSSKSWGRVVDDVAAMSFEQVQAEIFAAPLPLFSPAP